MPRVPLFNRARPRQLLLRTATVTVLSAAATAHATNDGLSITGLTQWSAIVGRPSTFTPTVTNPSGRALTFGIVNAPPWATLNTRTGQLSGTPPDIMSYYNISISVTDGVTTATTPYFNIRTFPAHTIGRPSIFGTPASSVAAGDAFAFQPSVRDPGGQPLSFSVKNKPAWANFSIATGRLYGTPSEADTGTYANVEISVSNGPFATALPAFNITVKNGVTSPSTSRVTVSWQLPTENTDGTALTDLAGIRIYYGTSASNLGQVVQVSSPYEGSYTIADLASGNWYFAAVAYTAAGIESALSSVVSKSIP